MAASVQVAQSLGYKKNCSALYEELSMCERAGGFEPLLREEDKGIKHHELAGRRLPELRTERHSTTTFP